MSEVGARRDLRAALRVDRIQLFPAGQVILGLETSAAKSRGADPVTQ